MSKTMYYFGFQKIIVYAVLAIMATQLIYFNSDVGFIHPILYFLFIMMLDVYKTEYRHVKLEATSTILYVVTTLILIGSSYIGGMSGYMYYLLISGLAIVNIKLALDFKRTFVNKEYEKINERNMKMFIREGKFLIVYSYIILLILLGIIGQAVYKMSIL